MFPICLVVATTYAYVHTTINILILKYAYYAYH